VIRSTFVNRSTLIVESSVETNDDDILVFCQHLEALKEDFTHRFQDVLNMIIPDWVIEPLSNLQTNTPILLIPFNKVILNICSCFPIYNILHLRGAPSNHCLIKRAMTQKSWKIMRYIIDFKNGSRCVFFLKRGR
jgi:hypothetical protein